MPRTDEDAPFLEMRGIRKTFPGVVANDDVDFRVRRGEIHGLLGENGAGKSTLMKVLYGLYRPDAGEVRLDGERLDLESPADAIDAGIGMVHQHFMLVPRLSVVENVVLGEREPAAWAPDSGPLGRLSRWLSLGLDGPRREVRALADEYGIAVDPDAKVWELDVGQQQRVEILKALYRDVDLLVLDEPTAVLTPSEAREVFATLRRLADEGLSVVFITHKLEEVMTVTDRVTVLRDGQQIETVDTDRVTRADLAESMVGREVLFSVDRESRRPGEAVLSTSDLRAEDERGVTTLDGVDIEVRENEVVGVAGVSGNGQRELAECLVGLREPTTGAVAVDGDDLTGAGPKAFIDRGVSFVPEDRHRYGCAPDLSVMHNAAAKVYRGEEFGNAGLLDYGRVRAYAETLVEEFDVRGVGQVDGVAAGDLSGGNLQKLVLGRELHRDPRALVAHQPTRGVDVGAIESIRTRLLDQRDAGTGVLLLSEDLDELFDLSDRLCVLYEGRVVFETTPAETTPEAVGLWMTGGPDETDSTARRADATPAADGGER
jgi:simple sugar transport system ATP-binding protein